MAFLELRERFYRFTGTADLTMASLPAGALIWVIGANVQVGASAGTMILTVSGVTAMSTTDLAPTVTGFKRNTTPGPYLVATAGNVVADGTGITGSPDITFICYVSLAWPGSGEV